MKFKSQTDILFNLALLGPSLVLLVFASGLIKGNNTGINVAGLTLILAVVALLLWIRCDTRYFITGDQLKIRQGPIKMTIAITDIRSLTINKTLWTGLKLALARKGIIIKYNKYDEIYISPKDKDSFIKELQKINSRIEVTDS